MHNRLFLLLFILTIAFNAAYGDGKFVRTRLEKVPIGIPYQRAILMYEAGKETLILQSKYEATTSDANLIAWIVPVPSVPELATMDADAARALFMRMSWRSGPKVIDIMPLALLVGAIMLIGILVLLNRFSKKRAGEMPKIFRVTTLEIVVVALICLMLLALLMPTLNKAGIGVDILKDETVGIYDVKVIKGNDTNAVTGWLKENGFAYDEIDLKVFAQYVKKDWCFVTAKVNPKADIKSDEVIREGLAAPLILRFDAKEAVYPMALTATAGSDTEILLYVYSNHKVDCGERLKLMFARGEAAMLLNKQYSLGVEPNSFFEKTKDDGWYLCKFKGKLTTEQMAEDIIFKQADDDKPYRETIWRF
jgi:hypothetical protein